MLRHGLDKAYATQWHNQYERPWPPALPRSPQEQGICVHYTSTVVALGFTGTDKWLAEQCRQGRIAALD
jgi:hypothetical protein